MNMFFRNKELQQLYEQHKENLKDYPSSQQKEEFKAECKRFSKIAKEYLPHWGCEN